MKKVILTVMVLCGLSFGVNSAYAFDVAFDFDGLWDWGTSYQYNAVTDTWEAGTGANQSNPFDGSISQDLANGVPVSGDGTEDSYGIARVNTIQNLDNSTTIFDRATAPYELTVFFYGFDDNYINGNLASTVDLRSEDGRALVYRDTAKNFNPANPPEAGASATGRTAVDKMYKVTDGVLALDLSPHAFTDAINTFTLENDFNFSTYRGSGSVYFDVVGGDWAGMFDSNTLLDGTDINFTFTSFPVKIGQPGILSTKDWLVQGSGFGQANVVPEPTSMLLFGVGMLGLATLRKRKKAA